MLKTLRNSLKMLAQKLKLDNVIFECHMIQSISYNLTDKESTLLKVSAKMFEERYKFISFIESCGIRSMIDPGSDEYKLDLSGFPKTQEGEIQKIWYKLLYIMSAFHLP